MNFPIKYERDPELRAFLLYGSTRIVQPTLKIQGGGYGALTSKVRIADSEGYEVEVEVPDGRYD